MIPSQHGVGASESEWEGTLSGYLGQYVALPTAHVWNSQGALGSPMYVDGWVQVQ